jgi:SpoVK/Ycf46/Vps4 family AAA+-type ATPase
MPLPDIGGRLALLRSRMKDVKHSFTEEDFSNFGEETRGYSMADLSVVVKEIAMMPIREMATDQLLQIKDMNDIRPVGVKDMAAALRIV